MKALTFISNRHAIKRNYEQLGESLVFLCFVSQDSFVPKQLNQAVSASFQAEDPSLKYVSIIKLQAMHKMKMNGQLHASHALSVGKELAVIIG
jgi:hypothetical protein